MTSAADGPPARRRPPGRYDEPRRVGQRAFAVVLGALFLGLLAAIAWNMYLRYGRPQAPVQVRAFQVVDERAVRVEFTVRPPQGERVWCLVRARSLDGAEVGRQFVPVDPPPEERDAVLVRHELPTTGTAVSGEVVRCLPVEPPAGEPTGQPDHVSSP